jgi:hypothetical protein
LRIATAAYESYRCGVDVTSPVVMAGPPFAAGIAIVLLGLLSPRRVRVFVMSTGAFVMLCAVIGALVNIGIHAYQQEPLAVEGPAVVVLAFVAVVAWRATHGGASVDEDSSEDGDGGSPVRARGPRPNAPGPGGMAVDWREFDDVREQWARPPAREHAAA